MAPKIHASKGILCTKCIFFGVKLGSFKRLLWFLRCVWWNTRDLFAKACHSFEDQSSGENPGNKKAPDFFLAFAGLMAWKKHTPLELSTNIFYWLFQLDDSKSLHKTSLFQQPSKKKLLSRVPGYYTIKCQWFSAPMFWHGSTVDC